MNFLAPAVPDCIRHPLNLAAHYTNYDSVNDIRLRYEWRESIMSVVRVATAYGFFRLSEKALGAATFAAMKDNRLITACLFVGECLVSVPAMLIHVGGVAIRNNLPELFKAWTEKNVSNHAVGLGCFVLGVILLTSYARSFGQYEKEIPNTKITQTIDFGIGDKIATAYARNAASKIGD